MIVYIESQARCQNKQESLARLPIISPIINKSVAFYIPVTFVKSNQIKLSFTVAMKYKEIISIFPNWSLKFKAFPVKIPNVDSHGSWPDSNSYVEGQKYKFSQHSLEEKRTEEKDQFISYHASLEGNNNEVSELLVQGQIKRPRGWGGRKPTREPRQRPKHIWKLDKMTEVSLSKSKGLLEYSGIIHMECK